MILDADLVPGLAVVIGGGIDQAGVAVEKDFAAGVIESGYTLFEGLFSTKVGVRHVLRVVVVHAALLPAEHEIGVQTGGGTVGLDPGQFVIAVVDLPVLVFENDALEAFQAAHPIWGIRRPEPRVRPAAVPACRPVPGARVRGEHKVAQPGALAPLEMGITHHAALQGIAVQPHLVFGELVAVLVATDVQPFSFVTEGVAVGRGRGARIADGHLGEEVLAGEVELGLLQLSADIGKTLAAPAGPDHRLARLQLQSSYQRKVAFPYHDICRVILHLKTPASRISFQVHARGDSDLHGFAVDAHGFTVKPDFLSLPRQ